MDNRVLIDQRFMFVIETDHYAGHFLENLCAYCTGYYGENDKGRDCSDLFYLDLNISDDEENNKLASELNPFRGYIIDQLGEEGFSPCALWVSRKYGTNSDGDYALLTEETYDNYTFPALFGVCIYFGLAPTQELVDIIKERAVKFFDKIYPRLVKEETARQVKVEEFRLIRHDKYAEEIGIK